MEEDDGNPDCEAGGEDVRNPECGRTNKAGGEDVENVDDRVMIVDDATLIEGNNSEADRLAHPILRDDAANGEIKVDDNDADDSSESSSSNVLLSQEKANFDGTHSDDEGSKGGDEDKPERKNDGDDGAIDVGGDEIDRPSNHKEAEGGATSAPPSKDSDSSDESNDDSESSITSSRNSDAEDSIVEGTEIPNGCTRTIISTRQSKDSDAHDHAAPLQGEEIGAADDDETMNIDQNVDETMRTCELGQPSPDDVETSIMDESEGNQSTDDDSSTSSSSSCDKMIEVEENKKIKKLHSDDGMLSSSDGDRSEMAGEESDDDIEVTNTNIKAREENINPNANTGDGNHAKIVEHGGVEKGASSSPSKIGYSESSDSDSNSSSSSSSSSSSDDSGDEGSIVEGTEIVTGGTNVPTQKSQKDNERERQTSHFMSEKATPHFNITNSDQIFTQESDIVPTNLFGKRIDDANQHKWWEGNDSATPSNEEAMSKDARSAKRWESDSSSSSSSSSDSEESNRKESVEKREIPLKIERLANGSEVHGDKNPRSHLTTHASFKRGSSSDSTSRSTEGLKKDGGNNKEKEESNPSATPIRDDKSGSSSSSSDTSSSSGSFSDSDSESSSSSSSSSEDERRKMEALQQKTPVSTIILPVVRSSRGRRRTPLVSMNRKIIITTSTGVPKTESFAR
jgi:hypothetical protein